MWRNLKGKVVDVRFVGVAKDFDSRKMLLLDVDQSGWVKLKREGGEIVFYPPSAFKRIKPVK